MRMSSEEFEKIFGRGPVWNDSVAKDGRLFWVTKWDAETVDFIPDDAGYDFEENIA